MWQQLFPSNNKWTMLYYIKQFIVKNEADNRVLFIMQMMRALICLCMRAVWSGPTVSAYSTRFVQYCRTSYILNKIKRKKKRLQFFTSRHLFSHTAGVIPLTSVVCEKAYNCNLFGRRDRATKMATGNNCLTELSYSNKNEKNLNN